MGLWPMTGAVLAPRGKEARTIPGFPGRTAAIPFQLNRVSKHNCWGFGLINVTGCVAFQARVSLLGAKVCHFAIHYYGAQCAR